MQTSALSALGIGLVLLCVTPTPVSAEPYPTVVRTLIKNGTEFTVHDNVNTGTITICEGRNPNVGGCGGTWTCTNGNCSCTGGTCTPPAITAPKGKGGQANKDVTTRATRESCVGPCKTRSPLLQQNILESGGGFGTNKPGAAGSPGAGTRGGTGTPSGPSLR